MPSEEDTLFAKLAADIGCVTAAQVDECLGNQKAMAEMGINQDLGQIMVSKGYLSGEALREIRSELRGRSGNHEVIGPYEILEKLGQGGMGTVYKARIKTTNAVIALKVLPPHLAANETFVTRFHREAELAAKLDHPNIVVAIESGQSEGCHYFAMEYVEGETLGDRLKREGLIAEDQALQITRQVALGLERASSLGLVHRDIKPDNIFLASDGAVKVGDMGLAKEIDERAAKITQTGMMVGTPHYVSPEQAQGEGDVDIRTDIYSLGATLYHALTGHTPFEGASALAVLNKHLNEDLPWPADVNEELTDEVCALIQRMMAKDRADRYQDPLELIQDMDRVIRGQPPASELVSMGRSSIRKAVKTRKAAEAADRRRQRLQADAGYGSHRAISVAGVRARRHRGTSWTFVAAGTVAGIAMTALAGYVFFTTPGVEEIPTRRPPKGQRTVDPNLEFRRGRAKAMMASAEKYRKKNPADRDSLARAYDQIAREYGDMEEGREAARLAAEIRAEAAAGVAGIEFGNAKVKRLDGGEVEIVWEFDKPLDPDAWYLWNVLSDDAGGGAVRMDNPGPHCYNRSLTPRMVLDGDLEIEAAFSGLRGHGTRSPVPGVALVSVARGPNGKRKTASLAMLSGPLKWCGEQKITARSWPAGWIGMRAHVVRAVRRGGEVEFFSSGPSDAALKSRGKVPFPQGPVGLSAVLGNGWCSIYSARLDRLRVVGKPARGLEFPDPALAVPKKATAAEQWKHCESLIAAGGGNTFSRHKEHAAFSAQILNFPGSAKEVSSALYYLGYWGAAGNAVGLWEKAKGSLTREDAVKSNCHLRMGEAYAYLGQKEEAVRHLELGSSTTPVYAYVLAGVYYKFGDYGEAIRAWEHCVREWPTGYYGGIRAQLWIGAAFREKGDLPGALAAYRKVLEKWPTDKARCDAARKAIAEVEKEIELREKITFGNAKVEDLGGGKVEIVWEFDKPLDTDAWYLWNVLPDDAGGGQVSLDSISPGPGGRLPRQALVPRTLFCGHLEVEAHFSSLAGKSGDNEYLPHPSLSIVSAGSPAAKVSKSAGIPAGKAFTCSRLSPAETLGVSWPRQLCALRERTVKLVRRGAEVEIFAAGRPGDPYASIGKAAFGTSPVAIDAGVWSHWWCARHSVRLTRLRIRGTPWGHWDPPFEASPVPKKGTPAEQWKHCEAVANGKKDKWASPEALRACRALGAHFPRAAKQIDAALAKLEYYGAPSEAIALWNAVGKGLPRDEAIRSFCHLRVGRAYCDLGRKEAALKFLATGRDVHHWYAMRLGSTHFAFREYDEAIRHFGHVVAKWPGCYDATGCQLRIGIACREKGDLPAALAAYRKVLEMWPDDKARCDAARKAIAEIEKEMK